MVLETEPQHAENTHFIVKIQIPESMQRLIPGQTIVIGAVLQDHISYDILASTTELKFRFLHDNACVDMEDTTSQTPVTSDPKAGGR